MAVLEKLLHDTGYDKGKAKKLVDGFTHGFDLGYRGPTNRKDESKNLPLTIGSHQEIWEKMMKEGQT